MLGETGRVTHLRDCVTRFARGANFTRDASSFRPEERRLPEQLFKLLHYQRRLPAYFPFFELHFKRRLYLAAARRNKCTENSLIPA